MTQKERQARSREEIYQAALEEFGRCGYDGVNMERICGSHGISKGMMYHYYSSKDELFLLCVERTFAQLKEHVEREMGELTGRAPLEAVKAFFLVREQYFQAHPRQKTVFEDAVLHPPKHLLEQIGRLRGPVRKMNRRFIRQLVAEMPLRPSVDPKKAVRYLERAECLFQSMAEHEERAGGGEELHAAFEAAEEMLDMILFGILRQLEE